MADKPMFNVDEDAAKKSSTGLDPKIADSAGLSVQLAWWTYHLAHGKRKQIRKMECTCRH